MPVHIGRYSDECLEAIRAVAADVHARLALVTDRPLIIGLTGAPGSGKTTVAPVLAKEIGSSLPPDSVAVVVLDGFHYPRAALTTPPAVLYRGGAYSFDPKGILRLLRQIRGELPPHSSQEAAPPVDGSDGSTVTAPTPSLRTSLPPATLTASTPAPIVASAEPSFPSFVSAPDFDHSVGDPVEGAIRVPLWPRAKVIIVEGLWAGWAPSAAAAQLAEVGGGGGEGGGVERVGGGEGREALPLGGPPQPSKEDVEAWEESRGLYDVVVRVVCAGGQDERLRRLAGRHEVAMRALDAQKGVGVEAGVSPSVYEADLRRRARERAEGSDEVNARIIQGGRYDLDLVV